MPSFPTLPGLGWSVHKKPRFSTVVASHVSGREVRTPLHVDPIWNFEVTFDGLDSTSAGVHGALGAESLQTLMGFFLACQGKYGAFTFMDPTDYTVSEQGFGTGDGVTTTFPLVRAMGGFVEPVGVVFNPSAPTILSLPGSSLYAPNNLIVQSSALSGPGWGTSNATVSGGVSDPFGGTAAFTMTATGANGQFWPSPFPNPLGAGNVINSIWLRRRSGSGIVYIDRPIGSWLPVYPTSSWQRFSIASAPPSGAVSYYSAPVIGVSDDQIDMFGPQAEASTLTTPGPYIATAASPYTGGPCITAGGALVDPSAYTVSGNTVTFATAPASGAALQWSGMFSFLCRFDDDAADFEQFMANLWRVEKLAFRSVRTS